MANLELQTLTDRDATVAQVKVRVGNHTEVYTGSSKRHPTDTPDYVLGEAIAIKRALDRLTEDLEAFADSRMRETTLMKYIGVPDFFKEPNATSRP